MTDVCASFPPLPPTICKLHSVTPQAGPLALINDDSASDVDERVDSSLPGVAKVLHSDWLTFHP